VTRSSCGGSRLVWSTITSSTCRNFGYGRPKLTGRLYEALTAIKQRPATGAGLRGHLALRALQDQLPAGAPIAF
jgi:hypothetical protein